VRLLSSIPIARQILIVFRNPLIQPAWLPRLLASALRRFARTRSGNLQHHLRKPIMSKEIIHTDAAPAAVGPYSQAVHVPAAKLVFLSGQIGLEPGTGELVSENFEGQVRQSFANMQAVIEASGGTLDSIVKLTLFLTDLSKFASANAIMAEIIPQPYPARSTIGVASLPKGAQFEVEAVLAL